MTLLDYLSTLNSDAIVAIGCQKGSGFNYIGPVRNMTLLKACFNSDFNNKLLTKARKDNTLKKYLKEAENNPNDQSLDSIIFSLKKQLNALEKDISEYVPPLSRQVIEHYEKVIDDCEAIIISGYEIPGYWFRTEFDKAVKKNKLLYYALCEG